MPCPHAQCRCLLAPQADVTDPVYPASRHGVKILYACRSLAAGRFVTTVSAVTDATWPDLSSDCAEERPRRVRKRKQYLPSAQVVRELASLGPDLSKVAEELRNCLSDAAND